MRKKIGRRAVLKGAAASATVLAAPKILGAQGRSKNKIIVISDVHIGDDSPWVWYQKQFHEPYLLKLLDHVIANAQSIRELIILGDFVELWTYPPGQRPPTFSEIMAANPAIFGPNGKLSRVLTALGGRVTYVAGNHDMSMTQADLDLISNSNKYKIRLHPRDVYFPLGNRDSRIACAHGHSWTLFNAADRTTKHAPLPAGHYCTRAFAYMQQKTLRHGETVADLPNQGHPNGIDLSTMSALSKSVGPTFMDTVLNFFAEVTGMPKDEKIVLASGATTSIAEAKKLYRNIWARFTENGGGGDAGKLYAAKSARADLKGYYLPWFAQKLALEVGASLVVMGHTHKPISGLKEGFIKYVNTGFECPARPDIGKKHPTFAQIDINTVSAQLFQVTEHRGAYTIDPHKADEDTIVYKPYFDFSTYVTVDNRRGKSDLFRKNFSAQHGHYVVQPPAEIPRGTVQRFWIQDFPGPQGSAGSVTYEGDQGRRISLRFACPTGLGTNKASGPSFRTKSGSGKFLARNHVVKLGHPLFVEYTV